MSRSRGRTTRASVADSTTRPADDRARRRTPPTMTSTRPSHPPHRPPAVRRRRGARRRRPVGGPRLLDPAPPRGRLVHLLPVPRRGAGRRRQGPDARRAPLDERRCRPSTCSSTPAATAPGRCMRDPHHLAWVRGQARHRPADDQRVHRSLVYAAAGLLAGRPATTHWESLDLLPELDPTIDVEPRRPVRRRRQPHHQRRRQRRHRHGPAPGRPARRRRPGPRGPPRHPVRPAPPGLRKKGRSGRATRVRALSECRRSVRSCGGAGRWNRSRMPAASTNRAVAASRSPAVRRGVRALRGRTRSRPVRRAGDPVPAPPGIGPGLRRCRRRLRGSAPTQPALPLRGRVCRGR